jgi:HD-GYP domain-containing protein (c-di-GMP phosphodiesterase class II)
MNAPMATVADSAGLDPIESELIEGSRARRARRIERRAFSLATLSGAAFLAAAVPLALLVPSDRSPTLWTVALLVAAYAAASRVAFEIGSGFGLATQVVLVPMLFLLPPGLVPLAVAAGMVLGRLGLDLERAFVHLANSWYAFGPALVFVAFSPEPSLGALPVLVLALAAQLAFDFASTATLEGLAANVPPRAIAHGMARAYAVDAALAPVGLAIAWGAVEQSAAIALALPLLALLSSFARERRSRVDAALELSHAYRGTALLLGDVVEADDAYTGSHSRDVVSLSVAVAERLGLDAATRRQTEFAALLHDVGKIRIPKEIINKAGPLDADERALIETHTVEGERMLEKVGGLLGDVGRVVRSCHERWDGGGYPDGLGGEGIPIAARIVCACDAFSAITTDRPYRPARSVEEAIAELRACAGTHFDPRVVEALVATLDR